MCSALLSASPDAFESPISQGLWESMTVTLQGPRLSYTKITCVYVHTCAHTPSGSVMSNSLQPHGLLPTRLLLLWSFPGKNTGVGCHFLLQVILPTQGSNPRPLHWQGDSLPLRHLGSPQNHLSLLKTLKAGSTPDLLKLMARYGVPGWDF